MTPVSHGTIDALASPDPCASLSRVVPSPLVSPPLRGPSQESVSSASLVDANTSPFQGHVGVGTRARLDLHGAPVLSTGSRRFSAPGVAGPFFERIQNHGVGGARSWHGDAATNSPPPPISPLPPSPPVVPQASLLAYDNHFGRPLFLLPSGGRYRVRLLSANEFEVSFL